MDAFDERELRSFLSAWEVCEPGETLLERTKYLMRVELAQQARTAPVISHPWLLAIIGLALLLTINLFYMLTLGSILRLALPPMFTTYLSHSLVAFSAAEVCLIAGTILVFFFKYVQLSGIRPGESRMAHGVR
jgi:hypothetical protein